MLSDRRTLIFIRVAAAICGVVFLGGCMMQNQAAPALTGPSGYGLKMTITATPDTLPRDGSSQSVIAVNLRDGSNDQPVANRRLSLSASAGTLSTSEVVTDVGGNASFTYIAPSLNTPVTAVAVVVTPIGTDAGVDRPQSVSIIVNGPDVPVASFTFSPATPAPGSVVTFDASESTLNGVACASCSYTWDFGDGFSGSGVLAQHIYSTSGVQTVTLTVSSPGGTSSVVSKSLVLATPTPPKASFTVSPSSPTAGAAATFDASGSTVGTGATIVQYDWKFGDGNTGSGATATHTYAATGSYSVQLTVTDSLGRTATITTTVTVV